jgi:hypothetical protein
MVTTAMVTTTVATAGGDMATAIVAGECRNFRRPGRLDVSRAAIPSPPTPIAVLREDMPITQTLVVSVARVFSCSGLRSGQGSPHRQGHASRLIITRAERDKLVRSLQISFGKKLVDQQEQNLIVSSASVLRDYLPKKGYKCSDDLL